MLCTSPITVPRPGQSYSALVGCGQCIPCRVNRSRVWAHRLELEADLHADNSFITLSYEDAYLPRLGDTRVGDRIDSCVIPEQMSTLRPRDYRLFMKRLRKAWLEQTGQKLRFYLVGEYGDETERAHYHLALFGFPTCRRGRTLRRGRSTRPLWAECCEFCKLIGDAWGYGDVDLGRLEPESANYLAGYILKKMTRPDDIRLNGRHPEFSRMSNQNGGIGLGMMHDVASVLLELDLVASQGDVPSSLRIGKRLRPLGRYLTNKLRLYATGTEEKPLIAQIEWEAEMQRLRENQFAAGGRKSITAQYQEEKAQALKNFDAKWKIHRQRRGKL